MSIFSRRLRHVKCRTWVCDEGFEFPELSDAHLRVKHLEGRSNVGVAFSGGGTRSATATLGQLRALSDLGLLERIKYISCVSGGAWTCVPFTFLSRPNADETFLGPVIEPSDLRLEHLKEDSSGSFARALSHSVIFDDFVEHAARFAGDETFSRAIGDVFLKPFGIGSLRRFFTQGRDSLSAILEANPNMAADDFQVAKHNRPFLIVGGTFLHTPTLSLHARKYQIEMTPLYTGMYQAQGEVGSGGQAIGGGYVESFGFDSIAPKNEMPDDPGLLRVKLGSKRHRFTLSDVVGTSGAAPAEVLSELELDWVGFPEFRYWNVENAQLGAARTTEYDFGDGGNLENLGVIPLLLRKVDKMIVFVNTKHPLKNENEINTSMINLFGQDDTFTMNHVFRKDQFRPLVSALLQKAKAGKAAVHKATFTVIRNQHFGVEPGQIEILWVYNEMVDEWKNELREEIRDKIGHGKLSNFPHYKTFFQNAPKVIDLSKQQIALLANLSCWVVRSEEDLFRQMVSR